MFAETVDQENRGNHDHHEADHQHGELVDPLIKTGLRSLAGDAACQGTKVGRFSRVYGYCSSRPTFHVGTQEADIR